MLRVLTMTHRVGQDMAMLQYKLPYFLHRVSSKANNFRLCNLQILRYYSTNYFTESIIYHVPGMIYCLLFASCVYISCYYGNVQALHGADDIGARVPDSCASLSRRRFGPARTVTHYCSGCWRVEAQRQDVL